MKAMTDENENVRMNALYPEHAAAFEKAKLASKKWPSLKQVMKKVANLMKHEISNNFEMCVIYVSGEKRINEKISLRQRKNDQ
jgi:hypothetical protein